MEQNEDALKNDEVNKAEMIAESETMSSESAEKSTEDGEILKTCVELVKNISDILENGRFIPYNVTFNTIEGDNYNAGAINNGAGHGNSYYDAVNIGSNQSTSTKTVVEQDVLLDLSDYGAIYKYLKEHQQSPYCSLLIVLSIFDNSQYDLVTQEAKIFYDMMADEYKEIMDDKGEKHIIKKESFEISRQEATANFGVRFYQDMLITSGTSFWTSFIGFSSETHLLNVLRCVYSEFVTLKDTVTAFLTKLICSEKITLYVAAINTLKKICDINPEYFMSKIIVRLIHNKSIPSDVAVAQVLCSIAEHAKKKYSADKYLNFVPDIDKDIHYYIITLMMCRDLSYKRDRIGTLIRPILWQLIAQPKLQFILDRLEMDLPEEENFINNIDLFFNIGNRYAEYYIALISELYDILKQMKRNDTRREFVQFITLLFIQEDYNESHLNTTDSSKFKDMIFVRMVLRDKDTSNRLIYLWRELLKNRKFKRVTEKILENYLALRNNYVNEEIEYLKLEAFFSKLAGEEIIRNNILFFLRNISTRPQNPIALAGKIYQKIGGK
jgi:hypothetical protein